MAVNNDFPQIPLNYKFSQQDGPPSSVNSPKTAVRIINSILKGKTNNCGSFSCASGAASTTIDEPLCNVNSVILALPLNADAAIELTMGTFYIVPGDKSFVVYHFNGAIADRNFNYIVVG